jgi:hypothetical protein
VLLVISAILAVVGVVVGGAGSGAMWASVVPGALAVTVAAVLLFIPASRPVGRGVAVGYAVWSLPMIFYFIPSIDATYVKISEAGFAVATVAAIVAAGGWGRAPRTGTRVIAAIGAAITAVLTIVGSNLAWVTSNSYSYSCCAVYLDRNWVLVGDVIEFLVLAGVLVWAVIAAPSRRSAGLFIGLGVGLAVTVESTVAGTAAIGSVSLGAGVFVMVIAVIACVATAIAGLVVGGRPSAATAPIFGRPGGATVPAYGQPTVPAYGQPSDAVAPVWPSDQPYPIAQPYGAPMVMAAPTNTMAILALIFAFVFAPLGIIFGHIGRSQIRRTGEQGGGLALAGTILGYVFTGLIVVYLVFLVVLVTTVANAGTS